MFKRLLSAISPVPRSSAPVMFENVEERLLMAAGPRVKGVFADNRGTAVITIDRALKGNTVNKESVQLFAITSNGEVRREASVSYSGKKRQITVSGNVKANGAYKVRLISSRIRGLDGARLDGEFKGASKLSGNGEEGGDYIIRTKKPSGDPIARFTFNVGVIDVRLFKSQTPLTVKNFQGYADRRDFDNTFIHRLVKNFIFQGGGWAVKDGQLDDRPAKPAVQNEPHPGDPGNVRGTIAMAKLPTDSNSATNEWFFNLGDNRGSAPNGLDFQNSGFTVFGRVTNRAGLKVMDQIGGRPILNASSLGFEALPVLDAERVQQNGLQVSDLITVRRIATKMDVVSGASAKRSTRSDSEPLTAATAFSTMRVAEADDGVWSDTEGGVL